jgi:hypothetical protein
MMQKNEKKSNENFFGMKRLSEYRNQEKIWRKIQSEATPIPLQHKLRNAWRRNGESKEIKKKLFREQIH